MPRPGYVGRSPPSPGKDVPISEFDHAIEKGLCFCAAVMGTDLRHTPVVGGEDGYPDLIARPDIRRISRPQPSL